MPEPKADHDAVSTTPHSPLAGDGTTGRARGRVWVVVLVGLLLTLAAIPMDGMVARLVLKSPDGLPGVPRLVPRIGGDLKRELEFVQQFGAVSSLVIIGVAVLLLDRARSRRIADMALAAGAVALACNVLKLLIGRPRPKFDDPGTFLLPRGQYELTIKGESVMRHAWEVGSGISSDLWSMPSSHTAAGVALAVFLTMAYPRLKPLAIVLAALVGLARVLLGAHYPSDVVAGATIGFVVGFPVMNARLGERLMDRLTGRRQNTRLNS